MPKFVNGTMTLSLEESTSPAILKGYGGQLVSKLDETVTLSFPTMHHAASWADMARMSDYTWLEKAVASFGSTVIVSVMDPES